MNDVVRLERGQREEHLTSSLGTLAHFISLSLTTQKASADLPSLTALNTQASLGLTPAPVGSRESDRFRDVSEGLTPLMLLPTVRQG